MAKTTTKGTCPACFRAIALSADGKIARHGWSESGGRRAGEYGRAWHVGACFGVGWAPFEVSPAGTVAFLDEVLFPYALGRVTRLEVLATNPDLYEAHVAHAHDGFRWIDCPWTERHRVGGRRYAAVHRREVGLEQSGRRSPARTASGWRSATAT